MQEIHDFDAVKQWRWQIAFRGWNYVYSQLGRSQTIRSWRRNKTYPLQEPLFCNSLGSVIFGADFCESLRNTNFITARLIERGSLLVLVERRRLLRFEAGEICLVPPCRDYAEAPDTPECLNHYVTICGTLLPELLHSFNLNEVCGLKPSSQKDFAYLLKRGGALSCEGKSVRERADDAGFCFAMLKTLSSWRTADPKPPELAAALEFIGGHLAEPLPLKRLAAVSGCSVTRLSQYFRDVLKNTPHRYIVERRMEFARRSLQKGVSVKEIAQQCGYRNPYIFSAEFKKFHGVPPRRFLAHYE